MSAPLPAGNAARGLIEFFTAHKTAHNLLMILMVAAGLLSYFSLRKQFFPDINIPVVLATVAYPGASVEQVDEGLTAVLEPRLSQLADVRQIEAESREGLSLFIIEYPIGVNIDQKVAEIDSAVAAAPLPANTSDVSVRQIEFEDTVSRFVLSGDVRPAVLRSYGEDFQTLIEQGSAAKVSLSGVPPAERRVELDPRAIEALGLSVADIASLIRAQASDVAVGSLSGTSLTLEIGTIPTRVQDIEAVPLITRPDGSLVRLGQVAQVFDAPDPQETAYLYINGKPAVDVNIVRSVSGDTLEIDARVDTLVVEFQRDLPANITLTQWNDQATFIRGRINLLVENGFWGLLIVLVLLFIFMGFRSAIWVALGIPVALLGTFAVMLGFGQTINMISLFAILLSLGIIVDDAIVVAEHCDDLSKRGYSPAAAAKAGGVRMSGPVLASSLTTIAAFAPLFIVSGEFGAFIIAFPLVMIAVIVASLLECFLILPGHMKTALTARARDAAAQARKGAGGKNLLLRFRNGFDRGFAALRERAFGPLVRTAVHHRYATLTLGMAIMIGAYQLLFSGKIEQQFFPEVEFNNVFAAFELGSSADIDDTRAFCAELDRALNVAIANLQGQEAVVLAACYTGQNFLDPEAVALGQSLDTVATMSVELVDSDQRGFTVAELTTRWRAAILPPADLRTLTISEPVAGPAEQAINLRLEGENITQLAAAGEAVMAELATIPGVSDLGLSFGKGPDSLSFTTNDFGRALGLSDESIGTQLRAALSGVEAYAFIEGNHEVPVRVILAESARGSSFYDDFSVKGLGGSFTALSDITTAVRRQNIEAIERYNGVIAVTVSGDLDQAITSLAQFQTQATSEDMKALLQPFSARLAVGGGVEQQAAFFADLGRGAIFGLISIFVVLAWVFSSYTRPFVVMSVIPFGIVGAVVGHWLLGMPLGLLSYISIFGLSGVVVNDSIVLVARIDERAKTEPLFAAIVGAAKDRLRAVLLTSLTTIGGLLPLLFETSIQAQFLIPMAVTIVFGLAFSTVLILVFVPALVAIQRDIGLGLRAMSQRRLPSDKTGPQPAASG